MIKENRTYMGDDGLLYCKECKEPLEAFFPVEIMGLKKHPRMCLCGRNELEEQKQRMKAEEMNDRRNRCFQSKTMHTWTFENDNGMNPKMELAKMYVKNWQEMKQTGSGLLLWGSVGTGKSYAAGCIANALMEQGVGVRMTNFATIINDLFKADDKNEYIRHLTNYGLLIIDDLGIERNTEYSLENVFNVIDARYVSGKPMIITTNMELNDLKGDKSLSRRRIYDRILERCIPICMDGANIRTVKQKEAMRNVKKYFGEEASNE